MSAWNQSVTGKNQRKITSPTMDTAIHTINIASIILKLFDYFIHIYLGAVYSNHLDVHTGIDDSLI